MQDTELLRYSLFPGRLGFPFLSPQKSFGFNLSRLPSRPSYLGPCIGSTVRCKERSGDGESPADHGEAEVFRQFERPNGIDRPVVRHGRYKCDCVADQQRPPCPAITTAKGGDSDGARHQPERHVKHAVHPEKYVYVLGRHRSRTGELRPGPFGEALITGGEDRCATWAEQVIRQCSRHRAPRDKSRVDDEDENQGDAAPSRRHRRPGSKFLPVFHFTDHSIPHGAETPPLPTAYVGSPPVSLRIQRMHVCPKSTPSPYIIGHAPAITLISCWRQYSTASGETLDPFPMDWCIQTRRTPASLQSRTIRSVVSGRVTITTPSTAAGIDFRSG